MKTIISVFATLCITAILSGVVGRADAQSTFTAKLIRRVDTSGYLPPAPDTAGIIYLPEMGRLLISDSEVNEMTIFEGANLFTVDLTGTLLGTGATISYSSEPTGLAYNPLDNHLYVSDDVSRKVYIVDAGADGVVGSFDDTVVRSFDTVGFGSTDPEGIAYHPDEKALYIADGLSATVYKLLPGTNGVFDGVSPGGDDLVTTFGTAIHGVVDPEGIAINTDTGTLYIVGKPANVVIEVTTDGSLLRIIDISEAQAVKPAGLSYGPSSENFFEKSLYIVARGVDNNSNPAENDGVLYEMTIPQPPVTPISTPVISPTIVTSPSASPSVTDTPSLTTAPTGSASATPVPARCEPKGDIDCSGEVNLIDLSILLSNFNKNHEESDLDGSGEVNLLDLSALLSNFGSAR